MSSLVVFTFPTQGGAQEVLDVVKQLQREQLLELEDAAVVWREPDGKPKVKQANSLVGPGESCSSTTAATTASVRAA